MYYCTALSAVFDWICALQVIIIVIIIIIIIIIVVVVKFPQCTVEGHLPNSDLLMTLMA